MTRNEEASAAINLGDDQGKPLAGTTRMVDAKTSIAEFSPKSNNRGMQNKEYQTYANLRMP